MRDFDYSRIKDQKWDSKILGYIAAIYKEAGKQEMCITREIIKGTDLWTESLCSSQKNSKKYSKILL